MAARNGPWQSPCCTCVGLYDTAGQISWSFPPGGPRQRPRGLAVVALRQSGMLCDHLREPGQNLGWARMSYRLRTTEPIAEGLARVARKQLDGRLEAPLEEAGRVTWVHETRKSLKRTRALLRLFRAGIGRKIWKRENEALRDIGRRLGELRERDVVPTTIRALAATAGGDLAAALARLGEVVGEGLDEAPAGAAAHRAADTTLADAVRDLGEARRRLAGLAVDGAGSNVLAAGLAATHRLGREALDEAAKEASDANVHELRKAVQTHWRQLQLLERAWPKVIGARIEAARDLAEQLGAHQDLAVLAELVRSRPRGLRAKDRTVVAAECRERQSRLRAEALPAARRLFAAEPEAFATELARLWQTAVEEDAAAPKVASGGKDRDGRRKGRSDPAGRPRGRAGGAAPSKTDGRADASQRKF